MMAGLLPLALATLVAGTPLVYAALGELGPMALCIRTVGILRAKVKIGLANLTYNIRRLVFHTRPAERA